MHVSSRRLFLLPALRVALIAAGLCLPAAGAAAQDLARGEQLYAMCQQCHGAAGQGNPAALAPAIAGLGDWYVELQLVNFRAGWRGGHWQDISGMRMRPMSMWLKNEEDIKAVSAYVGTLPPVETEHLVEGGDATRGKELYAACVGCHAADGKGNPQLKAPSLLHTGDWYVLSQLDKYKQGIRGWDPADSNGAIMRGMVGTLTDEQAMKDVVAYIMTLADQAQQ